MTDGHKKISVNPPKVDLGPKGRFEHLWGPGAKLLKLFTVLVSKDA